jgi:hypothetical protein
VTYDKERRGEPVLLLRDAGHAFDPPLLGTIEWKHRESFSICTEPGGARFQASERDFKPDPGGRRPLWERRRAEDGEAVRREALLAVTRARDEVVEAAMVAAGFRGTSPAAHDALNEACVALNKAERKLRAAAMLGMRIVPEVS